MRFFTLRKQESREDQFYTKLFIDHPAWNKPEPNNEEALRWNIIEKFVQHIQDAHKEKKPPLDILDLGCGRGWLSNLLSNYGQVIGIEPVKAVVEYGKQLFPALNLQCGTAKNLLAGGYAGAFDILVCSEVIEHIKDDEKNAFAQSIHQLLKEKGYLIITTPRKEMQAQWQQYTKPEQPIEDWMTEAAVNALFEKQGFKNICLERLAIQPSRLAPPIAIYQLWLFQKICI